MVSDADFNETLKAYKELIDVLYKYGYDYYSVVPINGGKYQILIGNGIFEGINILMIYKKELYFKFGQELASSGARGIGETVNSEDLAIAYKRNCKLIARIDPHGEIYIIGMNKFIQNSIKHQNKEGKDVRSISIHEFKHLNRELFSEYAIRNGFSQLIKKLNQIEQQMVLT